MVIKVKNPRRWMTLPFDEVINLEGEGLRPVRLEVNAEAHASFKAVYPDGTVSFLAAFQGMETIEFVADGPVEVWVTSDCEVNFYTDDGRNVAFVDDGKVNFAKPHVRRTESEQTIYMQGLMLANMQRRNEELEEFRAEYEAREAEREANAGAGEGGVAEGEEQSSESPASDEGTGGVVSDDDDVAAS